MLSLYALIVTTSTTYAQSTTQPIGHIDLVNSDMTVQGWALDQDVPSQSLDVHFYIDGAFAGTTTTDVLRQDVNAAYGVTGQHGFTWTIPAHYRDGINHTLIAYAINSPGGVNPQLQGSPYPFTFAAGGGNAGGSDPVGHIDLIDGNLIARGWALDQDVPNAPIEVHFYIGGTFVGSTVTDLLREDVNNAYGVSGTHGFAWQIPPQYRDQYVTYALEAHAINEPENPAANRPLTGSPMEFTFGNSEISNMAGAWPITIRTTPRLAGAIDSLTWGGVEFIDSYDHGRQMQSAANFDGLVECYNPTEAGSSRNHTGPTSTSRLQALNEAGNVLQTQTQMAFWLEPGQPSHICDPDDPFAKNTTKRSAHIHNKEVTIGFENMPHVIQYLVQYTIPVTETHVTATFEATTAYLPLDRFNTYWTYNPNTDQLVPETLRNDQPGVTFPVSEGGLPVIISSADGNFAMGVYSPAMPNDSAAYGNYYYALFEFTNEEVPVSKWSCVFNEQNIPAGATYNYGCYAAVGTLENVRVSIDQLHDYFQQ